MGHGRCPYGQKFQPRKTKPFSWSAPKSLIPQIAKNASFSPAHPNLWLLLVYIMTDFEAAKFGYFATHNILKITPFWWHTKIVWLSFCCRGIYVNVMESTNIEMVPVKLCRWNKRNTVKFLRRRLLQTNSERSFFLVVCFLSFKFNLHKCLWNCNYVNYALPLPPPPPRIWTSKSKSINSSTYKLMSRRCALQVLKNWFYCYHSVLNNGTGTEWNSITRSPRSGSPMCFYTSILFGTEHDSS